MDSHVSAVDGRLGWTTMLDLSSNMVSNHKMDRLDVSGMSVLGGIDTKFGYLALLDLKLYLGSIPLTWLA